MLRPSVFQNNGNNISGSTDSSAPKSILRPSSFQLASSSGNSSNEKSDNTPSTTTETSTAQEITSNAQEDSKISSTTNSNTSDNDESGDGSNSASADANEAKSANPFKNADIDDMDDDISKPTASTSKEDTNKQSTGMSSILGNRNPFTSANLFAAAASKTPSTRNGSESNMGFVFGQNIHERIVGAPDTSTTLNNEQSNNESCSGSQLFAAAAAAGSSSAATSTSGTTNGSDEKSNSTRVEDLTKAAREYEESRVQKRKYDEVETFTGEENEVNIIHINCKLFAFVSSNWEERGPGTLRLNDPEDVPQQNSSRVVFRTMGSLRVVLNTNVWKDMVAQKSSEKSLRFTAIDAKDGQARIFLVMARQDEIHNLYNALQKRIKAEQEKAQTLSGSNGNAIPDGDNKSDDKNNQNDINEPCNKKEKTE